MTINLSEAAREALWGDAALLKHLEVLEQCFRDGDKSAIWTAIDFCGHHQLVLPDWLRDAVSAITRQLRSGELATFDQAFGIKLESRATRRRNAAIAQNQSRILAALMAHRAAGGAFNAVDFEEIAERLGLPRNHVEDVHRQYKNGLPGRRNYSGAVHAIIRIETPMPKRHGRPIVRDVDT